LAVRYLFYSTRRSSLRFSRCSAEVWICAWEGGQLGRHGRISKSMQDWNKLHTQKNFSQGKAGLLCMKSTEIGFQTRPRFPEGWHTNPNWIGTTSTWWQVARLRKQTTGKLTAKMCQKDMDGYDSTKTVWQIQKHHESQWTIYIHLQSNYDDI